MKQKKILVSMVVLSSLTACSVHPLPEDVTPDDTLSIVKKIRCEAKEPMKEIFLRVLNEQPMDPESMAVYDLIKNENHDLTIDKIAELSEKDRLRLIPWLKSGIGMTFVLTANVDDNGSADAKFALPFSGDMLNLTINAGKKLSRKNARSVTLSETWYSVGKLDCAQINVARRNYLYPLTGRVGMAEVINTYFGLRNGLSKLEDIDQEGKKKGKGGREKNLEKFSDQLTFTTELSGGVKPSLVLAPVKEKLHLASANGDFGGARKDVHDVTIVLSYPVPEKPETKDMVIELKDNVSIVVKVPVKKSTKPQPPKKAGLPQKQGIRESDFLATPELSQQLIRELDRLQDLDASRRILDATER